jgi:hypothetical protein
LSEQTHGCHHLLMGEVAKGKDAAEVVTTRLFNGSLHLFLHSLGGTGDYYLIIL